MRFRKQLVISVVVVGLLALGGAVAVASAQTRTNPAGQPSAIQQTQPAPQAEKADQEKPDQAGDAVEKEDAAGANEANDASEVNETNLPNGGHDDPQGSAADHQYEGTE